MKQENFNKKDWSFQGDAIFAPPHRKAMLLDLTQNHKLVGLKYSELIDLLGRPNFTDSNSVGYEIIIDYGNDIDPVYTKDLYFSFGNDSIVTAWNIRVWKN